MRLYKRKGVYYADLRGLGLGRVSTRCTDRRAAEREAARLQREHADPARVPGKETLGEAVDDFLAHGCHDLSPETIKCYRAKGGQLLRIIGRNLRLSDISNDDVRAYIEQRKSEHVTACTILKELGVLRKALKEAHRRGRYHGPIEALIPAVKNDHVPRDRWLEPAEYVKLRLALKPRRRLWLDVAVYTGGRYSEIDGIRWESDVDLERGFIRLPGTKTARSRRWIPIAPPLHEKLGEVPLKSGRVVERWGNAVRDLKQACVRVGIDPISTNDLRRTFSSWLLQKGASTKVVAELLGHTTTRMVDRVYGHLSTNALRQATNLLDVPNVSQAPVAPSDSWGAPDSSGAI